MPLPTSAELSLQVTELFDFLLEAQVWEILIVAGIAFLGIAVVGRAPGRVEPGKHARIAGGVVGSLLVVTGVGLYVAVPPASSAVGSSSPASTAAPTSSPVSTETSTPTAASVSYPSGFDESGFTDRDRAVEGLLRALQERSFTSTTRIDAETGTSDVIVIEADPETSRVYKVHRRNGSIEAESFFDAGTTETRTPGDSGFNDDVTSYERAVHFDGQFEEVFRANLSDPEVTREAGRTLITYDASGDGVAGNLTVTDDGFFVRYRLQVDSNGRTYTVRYEVSDVGSTTVEEPDWVGGSG